MAWQSPPGAAGVQGTNAPEPRAEPDPDPEPVVVGTVVAVPPGTVVVVAGTVVVVAGGTVVDGGGTVVVVVVGGQMNRTQPAAPAWGAGDPDRAQSEADATSPNRPRAVSNRTITAGRLTGTPRS